MEILPTSLPQRKIEGANENKKDKELMDVCKDFESVFIHMMLKEMRKTIPEGGFVEKSTATNIFEDMFDEEISKEISNKGDGIGLAKVLYNQFKRQNVNL